MKDLVKELKKKNLISESAFDSLTVSLHNILINYITS